MVRDWVRTLLAGYGDSDTVVVHLLGGPSIFVGARRMVVPEASKRLLAFVTLHGGRVARRHASGTLWPDVPERRAAGNLRSALWRLNRSGVQLIDADKAGLTLHDGVRSDVELVTAWADRLDAGSATTADLAVQLPGAAALELLPGWYDDWALSERDQLQHRILHALERLSGELAARGRAWEAVRAAMLAVSIEPLRESAQHALLEAHLAQGNWSEAAHQFEAYRRLLGNELGVEPNPALAELLRPIRRAG